MKKALRIHKSRFARLRRRFSRECWSCKIFKKRREIFQREKNEKPIRKKME